jgi:predicted transcriptional regulator
MPEKGDNKIINGSSSGGYRRSAEEIIAKILEVVGNDEDGMTKMKIMYDAFLTHSLSTKYIGLFLQDDVLIKNNKSNFTYAIADEGLSWLKRYKEDHSRRYRF